LKKEEGSQLGNMPLRATPEEHPHCKTRLVQAPPHADNWDEEERSEISGLRMSMLSVALILLLVAVLLLWQLLPGHYLVNYVGQAITWLLAISIPVVALAALVSSIMDLMRIGETDGEVAGKGSAVAGLILSLLVLTLCVVFFFSFKAPGSSKNADASQNRKDVGSRSTRITAKLHEEKKNETTGITEKTKGDCPRSYGVPCPRK
jgi:uncharacterized membrane protein